VVEIEDRRERDREGWNTAGDGKGLRKAEVGLMPPKWVLVLLRSGAALVVVCLGLSI
jgi:hypothetical protein